MVKKKKADEEVDEAEETVETPEPEKPRGAGTGPDGAAP